MTEKFYFDFFQIPAAGVDEPDLDSQTRTDANTTIRRPIDMKISNFGALLVGARLSSDYTRANSMAFKNKGESEDWSKITEDTGIGQNVKLHGVSVNYNPHIWGNSIKFVRDDQFLRMTMSKDTGTSTTATQVDQPRFDVMDTKVSTADGIMVTTNYGVKNWPSEGWYSFGKKHDFVQNQAK